MILCQEMKSTSSMFSFSCATLVNYASEGYSSC